ncbi:MAG: MBL fold metallo-hydrolase [Planctomycetota bacterium]
MRVTFIGCGTAIPRPGLRPTSLWIDIRPDVQLRIDCGPGAVHSTPQHGLDWQSQTHQLVTHFHIDHVGDVPTLLFAFRYGRKPVPRGPLELIGPAGFRKLLTDLDAIVSPSILKQEFELRIREVAPDATHELAPGVTLRTAATKHTPESLAYRIDAGGKSIGFTGDATPAADLAPLFEGVDLLISECSSIEPQAEPVHLAVNDVATLAAASSAGHLVATHCYYDPVGEKLADRLAALFDGRVTVAYDGLQIEL